MRRVGWWSLGFAAALMVCCPAARASPDDASRADEVAALLRAGAQAARAKQWGACIDALTAALAIQGAPATAGDLGLCEEQAGRYAAAHRHLLHARRTAPPGEKDKAPWAAYQAALARVSDRVAVVVLTVFPTDARVLLDGRPLGPADGHAIAVEPGTHVFTARRDGHEDARDERPYVAGSTPNVQLVLTPKQQPPPQTTAQAAPTSTVQAASPNGIAPISATAGRAVPREESAFPCVPALSARGVLLPAACVGAAVFMVSAATAIGFEVHWSSLRGALAARGFQPGSCAPGGSLAASVDCKEIDARVGQRNDAANVMIGSGIVAAALAAGAGIAIALEPKRPQVSVSAGATGAGIAVRGEW